MSTTPRSGRRSSGAYSKPKGCGWPSCPSPNWQDEPARFQEAGHTAVVLRHLGRSHGLDGQPLHGQQAPCAATMPTPPTDGTACAPTTLPSCTAAFSKSSTPMCRSSSAASRHRCDGSPTNYWQDKLLPGILAECPADLLIYGMGERPRRQNSPAAATRRVHRPTDRHTADGRHTSPRDDALDHRRRAQYRAGFARGVPATQEQAGRELPPHRGGVETSTTPSGCGRAWASRLSW